MSEYYCGSLAIDSDLNDIGTREILEKIPISKPYKRVIQLELNEISHSVIDLLIAQNKLPNFAKLNREWSFYKTVSENKYEEWEP